MKDMELDERLGSVGGNRGYVGYSMSRRAYDARNSGRFPKTDFKRHYGMGDKVLSGLVGIGVVSNSEWHHTSKFGNRTVFYSFSEPSYRTCWEQRSDEIKKLFGEGDINGIRELFEKFMYDDMERLDMERSRSIGYKEYCDDYRKRNDTFDVNKDFKASNGCIVKTENNAPVVYLNGDRLSKRHGKNMRDKAISEYLKEKNKWKNGMQSYGDYMNANENDIEINESLVERIVKESLGVLLCEAMSLNGIYSKYYSDIDRSVFDAAVKADPTSKGDHAGRYVKWILNLAKDGKWKPGDSYETRDALSKFHRMRGSLQNGDINAYPSVKAVLDAVYGKKTNTDVKNNEAEKVYEDRVWLVVLPHTEEAAKLYGKGTKWCTAANDHENNYFDYYNQQGPLYINMNKVTGEKYQFHFESASFMDDEDNEIELGFIGLTDGIVDFYENIHNGFSVMVRYNANSVGDFHDGIAAIYVEDGGNYVNKEYKLLSPDKWYDEVGDFSEGLGKVYDADTDMYYYMKTDGTLLNNGEGFDEAWPFYGGFAKIGMDGEFNFIRPDGSLLRENDWFDNALNMFGELGYAFVEWNGGIFRLTKDGYLVDWSGENPFDNRNKYFEPLYEAMDMDSVYSKYYNSMDRRVFDAAVKADPTSDADHAGRYVKWILGLYKRGNWKPGDSYETKDALSKFHRLRNSLEIKDINGYQSVRQLLDAVSDKQSARDVKKSGAEKVYEDGDWLVIVPHTEEASKLYGKGTKWCTAADNDNYFDYYNKQGPLYINIRKRDGEKWQFHFESRSFMDAEDDPVSIKDIGLSDGLVRFYGKVCPYFKALFEYDYVGVFNEGFAAVDVDGKCNFIDTNGNLLSPDQWFDGCYPFQEGFARVKLDGKWNYIDTKGNILSPDQWFDWCGFFNEGFAQIKLDGKDNFIDTNGNILSPDQWFDWCGFFNEGFAQIKLDGKWYFLDTEGNLYDGNKNLVRKNSSPNDNLINEALSANDVYSKYYSDIDRSIFDAAVKADPTSTRNHAGRYVKWILNLARKGNWKPGDSTETKDALSMFEKYKNRLDVNDINRYNSVHDLYQAVNQLASTKTSTDIKHSEAKKVYEDDEWLVIIPYTEEASKLYGKGTKWCTAADNANMFDYYNNQGPLFININKKTGDKYQFHFETESFMDAEDEEIEPSEIGLNDGVLSYYESIGHKSDLLSFNELVDYYMGFVKKGTPIKDVFKYCYYNHTNDTWIVTVKDKENVIKSDKELLWKGPWFDDVVDQNYAKGLYAVYYENQTPNHKAGANFLKSDGSFLCDKWFCEICRGFDKDGYALVQDFNDYSWHLSLDGKLTPAQGTTRWHGIEDTSYFSHGAWSPGTVLYDGEAIDATDLEDYAWEVYRMDCDDNGTEPTEEGYDSLPSEWFKGVLWDYFYAVYGEKNEGKQQRGPLLEAMSAEEVYAKYYGDMDKSLFDAAVKADPTSKGNHAGKYVKWIISLAMAGKWKPGDSLETTEALSKFDRMKGSMEIRDVNRYKSVGELLNAVSGLKSTNDIKGEGANKVYEDNEWLIVIPETEEASKLYGRGTKWCTAADKDNMFDYYNSKGPLFINIRKKDGQKWQFNFETNSFMDSEDEEVKPYEIGLNEGALKYYASIGHGKDVLPFDEAVKYCLRHGGFDVVSDQRYDVRLVRLRKKYNFLKSNGELLWDGEWFDNYYFPWNDFCGVFYNGKGYNFLNPDGELVWKGDKWFKSITSFYDGLARVIIDGVGYNFLKTNGELLWHGKQQITFATNFKYGFAKVNIDGGEYKLSRNGDLYTFDESERVTLESVSNRKVILNEEQSWQLLCEAMSATEIREKYYQDVPNLVFTLAMKADPTSKPNHPGRYVKWILELWRNGSWMPIEWERTNMVLKRFDKTKPYMENQDINKFKSMDELEDAIDSVDVPDSNTDIKNKGSEKVYEDDQWLVVRLDTWEASKLYGAGTKWCTSEDKPDAFDAYNSNGKLYLNIRKTDKSKFLLFLSNSGYGTEFKDATDHDTSFGNIDATKGLVEFYRAMEWKPDTAAKQAGLMESNKANRNIILTEEQEWRLICEAMSIQNIHDKYYPDIDMDVFKTAVTADPTSSNDKAGRYVKWICSLIRNGKWDKLDAPTTRELLSTFDRIHDRMEVNDINQYGDVHELFIAVSEANKTKSATEIKANGSQKEYEDSEWLIIWVYSESAMKLYGKGTKWCVSADDNNRFYDYDMRGSMYLNIRKRDNAKFLFFFDYDHEDIEFRDAMDEYVNPDTIGLTEGAISYYHHMCPELIGMSLLKVNNADEGLFRAKSWDGKWTFIDKNNKPFGNGNQWYGFVADFHDGFAIVNKYNSLKVSYVRPDGSMLLNTWFNQCQNFSEGMAAVKTDNGWTYIDTEGKVFPCRMTFEEARSFNNGVAAVKSYPGWSYVTKDGKLLRPDFDFNAVSDFHQGHGVVMDMDGVKYAIDINGNLSSPTREDNLRMLVSENESVETVKKNIILTEEQEWRLLCESMSIQDVHDKYYPDVDMDVFKSAVMADPTSSNEKAGRYVKWILGLYKRGSWKPGDSYETKDALSRFHRLRNSLEIKDINGYKSVRQLLDAVSDKQSARDVKKSGAEKVYEDGEWLVIVPHTEEASKLYGKGTKWCTAADNDNYFDYYNEDGPLYINIRKMDGEKWQFHFESRSFMDAEDDPVRIKDIGLSDGLVKFYEKVCPYFKVLFEYDYVGDFNEGFAAVDVDGKWNFIDTNGNLLSPDQWFDGCYPFHKGFAKVEIDGKWNYIDTKGNLVSADQWFDYAYNFREGFADVELNGKCNFIDTNGNLLSSDQWFDGCYPFHKGFAKVEIDGKWYYIDRDGNLYDKYKNKILDNRSNSD